MPHNKRNPNDIIEMKRLRFEEHLSIREIGERFGISRERVRQLIGNTGWYVLGHKDINNKKKVRLDAVIETLRKKGFVVAKDLSKVDQSLIVNRHKVRVFLANKESSPKKGAVNPIYSFTPRNLHGADLVILFISTTQDIFVIPANLVLNKEQIRFVWPNTNRPEMQKFQKFHNRFDFLTLP